MLATMPDVARDLMQKHARQDDGHCGVCRGGNHQTGRALHPCRLYSVALQALVERAAGARS